MSGPAGGILHSQTKEANGSTEYLPDESGTMIPYVSAPQCKETFTERVTGGAPTVSCGGQYNSGQVESQRATSMWDKKYNDAVVWQVETTVAYATDSI